MTKETTRRDDATTGEERAFKKGVREMWALGDYGRFAELVWEIGPVVVAAADVRPGQRVLDVATGTGNTAIRAAEAGADVVASDLTPENFAAGRLNAERAGVTLEWAEADAEDLPFEDAEFDVVTSSVGAMFAPKHQRVADELVRVCKPGGKIVMANFTPEGMFSKFIEVFLPYMPPSREGDLPPAMWGSEDHVRELFGSKVSTIEMTRRSYVERAESARAYCRFFEETFGPVVAIYAGLAERPEEREALDRAFLRYVESANQAPAGGAVEIEYEYLLVNVTK